MLKVTELGPSWGQRLSHLPPAQNLFHHIVLLRLTLFLNDFALSVFPPFHLPDIVFFFFHSSFLLT